MAEKNSHSCDICGVEKKESNHWLVAMLTVRGFAVFPWSKLEVASTEVKHYNEDLDDVLQPATLKHICGQGCANKLLSTTIEGWQSAETIN